MQLVSKISNVCDPDPTTSQMDGQTVNMQLQDRALQYSASRRKNCNHSIKCVWAANLKQQKSLYKCECIHHLIYSSSSWWRTPNTALPYWRLMPNLPVPSLPPCRMDPKVLGLDVLIDHSEPGGSWTSNGSPPVRWRTQSGGDDTVMVFLLGWPSQMLEELIN